MKKKNIISIVWILPVIVFFCVILASCDNCSQCNRKKIYTPTGITYDGYRITWDKIEKADYYTLSINGGDAQSLNSNVYAYSTNGEFDVVVSSVKGKKTYSTSMHFIPLDTITDITISDDGLMSWPDIEGATSYQILLNGNVLPKDIIETHYQLETGTSRIKVRPIVSGNNSYYSKWSEEKQVTKYVAPTNINYDGYKITWNGSAMSFEVTINGQTITTTEGQLLYNSDSQDFRVEIKGIGNHINSFDSDSTEEEFHYLKPCTDLIVEDGILHWSEIANAEGYEISINDRVINDTVKTNEYDKLLSGQQLRVKVRPFNKSGKYFSVWSVEKNIYILNTPVVNWNSDLDLDGAENNNLIWDLLNGAVGYEVLVTKDGAETKEHFGATITSYANAYSEVGVYTVQVKALADMATTDYCDSKYSTAITIERLAAPTLVSVTSNPDNVAEGFTVNYSNVQNAIGYQLYKDGAIVEGKYTRVLAISDNDVVKNDVTTMQNYTYSVRSVGTVKKINGKTYVTLGCLTTDAMSFNITVLPMPTDLDMSGFDASWSAISGNNGYAVKHNGATYTATQTKFDLSTLHAGNYTVSVCARGNGTTTLASNYTASINITRIAAPSNIRISYGEGEGKLEYDHIADATGYEVYYGEREEGIPENAWDNMYQFIKTEGTTISMRAVANRWNDQHTVYYMTSEPSPTQQFIRLAKPEYPENPFANSVEFVWNASNNINTAEYTPTYQVFESGVMQTGGVQNGTRYNIQYLDGGKYYTFRVKAVGNDTKYLDSELSDAITIYKLEMPTITISNNEYHWAGVANATAYVLEIDGEIFSNQNHTDLNDYTFQPNFTTTGNHTVKLYAVGDDGRNNINSNVFTFVQQVKSCISPEITYRYTKEQVTHGGAIEVEITKPSDNALKYQYEIAGETILSDKLKEAKVIESAGKYLIRVKAIGGTFDNENIYYKDSQYAGGGTASTITLLAAPTLATFTLSSDGVLKWAAINDAIGYDYEIKFDDGEFQPMKHVSQPMIYSIGDYKNYKSITIRVRATGRGNTLITSEWVEWTWNNPNK